jgi:hypothetical protein
MNHALSTALAAVLLAAPASSLLARDAQTPAPTPTITVAEIKEIVGKPETITATVAAIDYDARVVMLRSEAGVDRTLFVGKDVSKLQNVKVGDRVKITYYMSLATEVLQPGEEAKTGTTTAVVGTAGSTKPAGMVSEQERWLVTVNAVDLENQTVTITGEKGRTVTVKGVDKAKLAQLKPNDRVEIVLTAAAIVNVER